MAIRTYGPNAVDWEQRVDLDRLRDGAAGPAHGRRWSASDARRPADLRLRQHPLHDRDPHRHLGDGQADPVRPAAPRRRAGPLGLRLGRASTTSSTTRGSTAPSAPGPASPRCAAPSTPTPGIAEEVARKVADRARASTASTNEPLGVDLVEMPILAALRGRGHRRRRRPAGLPRGPPDQDRRTRSPC